MVRVRTRVDSLEAGLRFFEQEVQKTVARLEREVSELRADLRAQRTTIDQLLIARQEHASSGGLASLLRESSEELIDPEERKRLEEESEQFRVSFAQLYGDGASHGE